MTPQSYFEQAKRALHLPVETKLQSAYQFGVDATELAQLVLTGTKTATTSAYDLYETNEPLPQVGAYDVILDGQQNPVCVTKTDHVTIQPYLAVNAQHAFNEGEGDRSLSSWRRAHTTFFRQEYQTEGHQFNPQTAQMVLEQFHVVYPAK
ncbi:ASCH domain-containing protein [Lactiplantibacillus garii]|uniref:ASCH domain-containing protein n=1 Tax=Lactiplantibacillus garii TaxID=2306423 RepID=A0A426D530_9LACO|nr:ASCH domain-containing protein [Lactiplantibacillus garii]RRK09691.1 ASCH domain-containing protein [Lactiplantibacillus garii]